MDSAPDWDSSQLAGALRLEPAGADRFVNPRLTLNMSGALFGGQFVANALSAAMLSTPGRVPRTAFGAFIGAGRAGEALELEVERVHDGRTLSHRHVTMRQGARVIFQAQISLDDGAADVAPRHMVEAMPSVPPPESLDDMPALAERHSSEIDASLRQRMLRKKSVQVKPVDGGSAVTHASPEPRLAIWMQPTQPIGNDPVSRYAGLAFLSDFWLCWPALSPYVDSMLAPCSSLQSIDHAMWFHADPQLDDWLYYELDSPASHGSYGVGRGAIFTRDGRLVATAAQQALLPDGVAQ